MLDVHLLATCLWTIWHCCWVNAANNKPCRICAQQNLHHSCDSPGNQCPSACQVWHKAHAITAIAKVLDSTQSLLAACWTLQCHDNLVSTALAGVAVTVCCVQSQLSWLTYYQLVASPQQRAPACCSDKVLLVAMKLAGIAMTVCCVHSQLGWLTYYQLVASPSNVHLHKCCTDDCAGLCKCTKHILNMMLSYSTSEDEAKFATAYVQSLLQLSAMQC